MANEYEKALSHAKAGRLETAQQILIGLEDERSEKLLAKVNKAIAARGASAQAVAEGMKQADKAKQQPKASSKRPAIIIGALVLLIGLAVVLYFTAYLPSQAQAQALRRQFAIDRVCSDVFMDYYIDNDISAEGFNDACRQETEFAIRGMEEEIDYCLSQTQNGVLKAQMLQCLVDNGFKFSGVFIGTAE